MVIAVQMLSSKKKNETADTPMCFIYGNMAFFDPDL